MKRMRLGTTAAIIAFVLPFYSMASEISDTTITKIMIDRSHGQKLFIQVAGDPVRSSGHCHVNTMWDYVLSIEDELGKHLNAQILTAYAGQKQVKLAGTDLCDVHAGNETLRRVEAYQNPSQM